jgi:hypothetical protein
METGSRPSTRCGVDDNTGRVDYDLILSSLSGAVRKGVQAMVLRNYEFTSDWAEKHIAEGEQKGRLEGRQEGRLEGRQEGRLEGRQEGRLEGQAAAILTIVKHRGWPVTPETEQRIRSGTEAELERWLLRAVTAAELHLVFAND